MIVLLDFDGVLITTPSWKPVDVLEDGFLRFNEEAVKNLQKILLATNASVILTTTHRIRFAEEQWKTILAARGIVLSSISKINACHTLYEMESRAAEIQKWVDKGGYTEDYVILDDDRSIHALPDSIKNRWVMTHSHIGLDEAAADKAIEILLSE